jgi:hypothetical protein
LRPFWANGLRDSSRITRAKWTGGVAQVVESLFCKHEALTSNTIVTRPLQKKSELDTSLGNILRLKKKKRIDRSGERGLGEMQSSVLSKLGMSGL